MRRLTCCWRRWPNARGRWTGLATRAPTVASLFLGTRSGASCLRTRDPLARRVEAYCTYLLSSSLRAWCCPGAARLRARCAAHTNPLTVPLLVATTLLRMSAMWTWTPAPVVSTPPLLISCRSMAARTAVARVAPHWATAWRRCTGLSSSARSAPPWCTPRAPPASVCAYAHRPAPPCRRAATLLVGLCAGRRATMLPPCCRHAAAMLPARRDAILRCWLAH